MPAQINGSSPSPPGRGSSRKSTIENASPPGGGGARAPLAFFRNDLTNTSLCFTAPEEILLAETPAEFFLALERVEALRRAGKWIAGYISYEAGYLLDASLVRHLPDDRRSPLLCLGVFAEPVTEGIQPEPPAGGPAPRLFAARPVWTFGDYEKRFERLHRHLRLGDCYQGNLTFPIQAQWEGDGGALFDALTKRQPVRYAAFVDLGGPIVISRSPELFFEVSADGWIETLPMKGTMPRGTTIAEDEALRESLRNDPKNQAENRMIVDLLRNDISRISEVGTLTVPQLFHVESYPTVHQMVSRVRARLREGLTFADILAALFPCGSVTGAPKISAMKILRALEEGPRNVYCGAIGWLAPEGRMRFNVAIRTISLYPEGKAVFNVGGGVVFDSTARSEYEECLLKARFATGEALGAG